jgi:hypothetical protein
MQTHEGINFGQFQQPMDRGSNPGYDEDSWSFAERLWCHELLKSGNDDVLA